MTARPSPPQERGSAAFTPAKPSTRRPAEAPSDSQWLERARQLGHDCRNALCVAIANAQLLEEKLNQATHGEPPDAEIRLRLSRLTRGLQRMKLLLESQGEPEGPGVDLELVPVGEVVNAVFQDLRCCYPLVELQASGHMRVAVWLRGGRTGLERVVHNVVLNACQGDGRAGATRVRVRWRVQRLRQLVIECIDDGPGFARELLQARPGSAHTTTKQHGSGLGLASVQRLLQANGGSLELANAAGGGAVVRLLIDSRARTNDC